jgi:hypothetical protein
MISRFEEIFGVKEGKINRILRNRSYNKYSYRKKSGGIRVLLEPDEDLKELQRELYQNLAVRYPILDGINGVKDTSIFDHIDPHLSKKIILTTDIEDYFTNVGKAYVIRKLEEQGVLNETMRELIACVVTFNNQLPQGAPSSTFMACLTIQPLFRSIMKFSKEKGIDITLYVDDWAISGQNKKGVTEVFNKLESLLSKDGLFVSPEKTKIMTGTKKKIVGVVVGDKMRVNRKYIQEVRDDILTYSKQVPLRQKELMEEVKGKLNFIKSLNDPRAENLIELFKKETLD